jgi:hypothetical protein
MSVAGHVCMYDLWLGHFARSSLRRDVAFSPRFFLHKAVRVSTTGHQGSQYLLQGKRICQYSELASQQGPHATCLPFNRLGIEI